MFFQFNHLSDHLGIFSNSMAHTVIFILLVSLSIISSSTHVQSIEEGFISLDISNKGLNFAKDLIIKEAVSSLITLQLPQIEKYVKIPVVGLVHMVVSNVTIHRVYISSSIVQTGDTGISIVASGTTVNLSMDWQYSYSSWLFPVAISDKGVTSVQVEGMEVGLTLGLKNQQGTLKLSVLKCECSVKGISIKFDGGASWLYQGLVDAFGGKIASAVKDAISKAIRDGIVKLDSLLQSFPKEIPVDDIAALNITFTNDPVLSNSSIKLDIDGSFAAKDKVMDFNHHYNRNLRALVPSKGPPKMVGVSFHENVLNSASLVYYSADFFRWIVDKVPHKGLLNTAEWRFVVPELYKKYPNRDMNLNISITSPPIVRISQQHIASTVYLDVTVDVLDASDVIPVACISLATSVSGSAEISKRDKLAGSVQLNDLTMSLKWSKIGHLHMHLLQSTVSTILKTVLLPYVNSHLMRGCALPKFHGYALRNAQILCTDSRIVICSDVSSCYSLTAMVCAAEL